jgi:hypothetical protein
MIGFFRIVLSTSNIKAAIGFCLLAILLLAPLHLLAQVGTSDVLGTVTDSSGGLIPNAHVTIKNLGTSAVRTATTSERGDYIFSVLPNGSYSLSVEAQGFKKYAVTFDLSSGTRARFDAKLEVGAVNETVEVSAGTAALQTDSSTISSTIAPEAVQDLPLPNRNYFAIVETLPGVSMGAQGGSNIGGSNTSGSSRVDRRPFSTIVANGQSDALNNHLINGFDNNEAAFGNPGVRPTVDGIAEMKVDTTNPSAEYGRVAGAVANVITKSGTNTFHGSAFIYFRNEATDAKPYFATTAEKPKYRQNNEGGSIGGPIIKDKTFFFFAFERDSIDKGMTFKSTVPTKYQHDHPGDFSDLCADPSKLGIGCAGGEVVPQNQIDPFMLTMFKLYPSPNAGEEKGSNAFGYFVSSPNWTQRMKNYEVRVDHHFSANDLFFARYGNNPATTTYPGTFPYNEELGVWPVGAPMTQPGPSTTNTQNIQLDYVHIFSQTLLLDLKAGYTRYGTDSTGLNYGKGVAAKLKMPNAPGAGQIGDDLPHFGGPTFVWTSLGGPLDIPFYDVNNTFQYAGSMTWSKGSHNIKFGSGIIKRQVNLLSAHATAGFALMGILAGPLTGTEQRADFIRGLPLFFNRETPVYKTYFRVGEWNAYVQDDWRVTSKLTLNLGLRYDIFTPTSEAKDHYSVFDVSTINDGKPTDSHNFILGGTGGVNTDFSNLAPRLGFAYSLSKSFVIRGGFGFSYLPHGDTLQGGGMIGTSSNPPYIFNYTAMFPHLSDPSVWVNPKESDLNTWNSNPTVNSLTAIPSDFKSPRFYQANLAVQKEIGENVFTAAWVGVYGRRLAHALNLDMPNLPGPNKPAPTLVYATLFPNVNTISSTKYDATANYNGLQMIYSRRFAKGLSLNANWTWAHGLADSAGADNITLDYGNTGNDIRHRIAVTASYELPLGKSLSGLAGVLAKGWQLNGVYQWQTGQPFTITASAGCDGNLDPRCPASPPPDPNAPPGPPSPSASYLMLPSVGQQSYRPDIVGEPLVNGIVNLNAFAPPVPGTQGNEGVNQLRGPRFQKADISIFKNFQITEDRVKLQFRAEAFNISNTPSVLFTGDNTTIASWTKGTVTAKNPTGLVAAQAGKLGIITDTAGFYNPRQIQFALKLLF